MKKLYPILSLIAALAVLPVACGGPRETPLPEPAEHTEAPSGGTAPENDPKDETPGETENQPGSGTESQDRPADGTEERETAETVQYLRVTADGLNVRAGAGTEYPVLGRAQRDTLLACRGERDGWYETNYRGRPAYVSEQYVEKTQLKGADERIEAVVAAGEKYLGVPYVYGAVRCHDGTGRLLAGFSEEAFDCSSLMQYIFYGAGVLLDVTTRTQIKQGTPVAREDIARGDLLFFTNASRKDKTGIERVGHVALYLGGNYILHTASDFAKIELISQRRESYFLAARRVL